MKLKSLIVHGFKSFKERTTIHFDDGITGIVGPNGCGKSNIVDALFWVMGEQSAKHLRGNNMKDLIFSGSSKYSPAHFAEASLILENTAGKHIHIGNKVFSPSEIKITRKLYRNGETEYKINESQCRLKDIQEIFMDTGAGAKSYSIIAQGEINKLVQAKPVERRVMIEEVAGITKFKLRKRDSLKKIEATESNLSRLVDLEKEIENNLKGLKKQAEKAHRAKVLKDKIKRSDLVVQSHKIFDFLKTIKESTRTLEEKENNLIEWNTSKNTIELSLEDELIQKDDLISKVDEKQSEYNEAGRLLAASEERLNYFSKAIEEKEKSIVFRSKEINELKLEIDDRKARKISLDEEKLNLINEETDGFDYSDLEEQVENLKEELILHKENYSNYQDELKDLIKIKNDSEQVLFRNQNRTEELSNQLADLTTELEEIDLNYSGHSKQLVDERQAASNANELYNNHIDKLEKLANNYTVLKETVDSLRNITKSKKEKLLEAEYELKSLSEIKKALEGSFEGTSDFLKEVDSDNFNLLGNIISSEKKYAKSAEALLNSTTNIIINNNNNMNDLCSWIKKENKAGIKAYLGQEVDSLNEEVLQRLELKNLGKIKTLKEVIKIDSNFKSSLDNFFDGFFIVEDINLNLVDELKEINFKAITNLDGSIVISNNNGRILEIMSDNDSKGVIKRNNLINELTSSLGIYSVSFATSEAELLSKEKELIKIENDLAYLRDEKNKLQTESILKQTMLDSKLRDIEQGNTRVSILKKRKAEVSKTRLSLLEEEEGLVNKSTNSNEKIDEINILSEDLKDTIETMETTYLELKEELNFKMLNEKTFIKRKDSLENQISDIFEQIEKQSLKLVENESFINSLDEELINHRDSKTSLEKENIETADKLSQDESVLNIMKDSLGDLLNSMQERDDSVKKLTQNINKAEKQVVEINSKLNQILIDEEEIVRNVFEKYQIDLRSSIGKFLEFSIDDYSRLTNIESMFYMESENGPKELNAIEFSFTRRYGNDLKEVKDKFRRYKSEFNRLGVVNWQAIDDYKRQKIRYDFLKEQEEELKKSLEDLAKAISFIDQKSKVRFKTAFEEVDVRFRKVFPIIFGGGSAHLKVNGKLEDIDCGIEIIAQPPGKKMQNINLMSGGEKALTAVSLIFSIFLVKPSPFCLLDEVDAPLDDANVGRFNDLLREMSEESQFILITHNKKTMELNDTLYGVTMQEPGVSKAISVQLH